MAEDKLKKLEDIVNVLDRKTIEEDDFVAAFKQVIDYVKQSNTSTAGILNKIIERLDTFALQLKGDNEEDRKMVKQAVGEAMAEMRTTLDARMAEIKSGENGKDGLPGKDADEQAIIATLLSKIPKPIEPIIDTPDQLIEKVNKSSLLIAKERVEGLVDAIKMAAANAAYATVGITTSIFFKNGTQVGRAKNINFIEGSNMTITTYQTGDQMNVQFTSTGASGGTIADEEVPTDSGDHTNFTIAHTPNTGTFKLYRGGARQQSGVDYTLTGTALVLTTPLDTVDNGGETLFCDYTY